MLGVCSRWMDVRMEKEERKKLFNAIYLGVVQNLQVLSLSEAQVFIGPGIVVVEGHKDLCVGVGQLGLWLGNGRWVHDIVQCWIWLDVVWWVDGSANNGILYGGICTRFSEALAHRYESEFHSSLVNLSMKQLTDSFHTIFFHNPNLGETFTK